MAEFEGWNALLISVKERNGIVRVSDWEDELWMLISSSDKNVDLRIYPQAIPTSFIGKAAKEFDELKYNIACKTDMDALHCKCFLADFMDCGYGQRVMTGKKGWLAPLDIEDLTKIFSSSVTYYKEFAINTPETNDDVALWFKEDVPQDADNIFVSIYTNSLDYANSIMDPFYAGASEGCMVWCQFIINDEWQEKDIAYVFYN